MAQNGEPSFADLTYEALRSARRPLTFQEILDDVNRRRVVNTRNPKATIRAAISQGKQLVSLGNGQYGYLPHLLQDSLLRKPLFEKNPTTHPLIYPAELRQALWPSFLEIGKRESHRPVRMRLPNGVEVDLSLGFVGRGVWGCPMPEYLRRYLAENRAAAGDSLLIRVLDGEAGRCEGWFEPRGKRDTTAVAARNRHLADAAYQILRKARSWETPAWDLAILLLGRGTYLTNVAPDTLEDVLKVDARFADAGLQSWTLAESMTPEIDAYIRQRKELQSRYFDTGAQISMAAAGNGPSASIHDAVSKTLAGVTTLLSERRPGFVEKAGDLLRGAPANRGFPIRDVPTPLELAQELAYDAWEEPSPRTRISLARRALKISPDCADAYVLLAEDAARGAREAADLYAQGVAAGERAIGASFQKNVGQFWGILETRPYMRARLGLAHSLWELGRRSEAIQQLWEMLRLNPNDNLGIRYLLLSWLLESGQELQIERLLNRYRGDIAGQWAYGRALHAFRTEGDTPRARRLLSKAKRQNPHVPDYLMGRKKLPRELPDTIGIGDESEAIACAYEQMTAWHQTTGALAWLDAHRGRT